MLGGKFYFFVLSEVRDEHEYFDHIKSVKIPKDREVLLWRDLAKTRPTG